MSTVKDIWNTAKGIFARTGRSGGKAVDVLKEVNAVFIANDFGLVESEKFAQAAVLEFIIRQREEVCLLSTPSCFALFDKEGEPLAVATRVSVIEGEKAADHYVAFLSFYDKGATVESDIKFREANDFLERMRVPEANLFNVFCVADPRQEKPFLSLSKISSGEATQRQDFDKARTVFNKNGFVVDLSQKVISAVQTYYAMAHNGEDSVLGDDKEFIKCDDTGKPFAAATIVSVLGRGKLVPSVHVVLALFDARNEFQARNARSLELGDFLNKVNDGQSMFKAFGFDEPVPQPAPRTGGSAKNAKKYEI